MKAIKIINAAVFCLWLALISLLLYKNYTGVPLENSDIIKKAFRKTSNWYDIYAGKNKIGHANTTIEKAGNEIIITEKQELKVTKNGKETLLIEEVRLLTDTDYKIKSTTTSSVFKGGKGVKASGSFEDDAIIFILESTKRKKTHKVEINRDSFYHLLTLVPILNQNMPVPGSPFKALMLDLSKLSINDIKVVLEEIRPVKIGANVFNLYKFSVGDTVLWINEKGYLIKKESPSGAIFYSEIESIAIESDSRVLFDYTSLPFFKSNILIPDAEALSLLKVKIKGLQLYPQLYENRLVALDGNTLTIKKANIDKLKEETYTLPYKESEFSRYLKPDNWIMSDYKPLHDTGLVYARFHKFNALKFTNFLGNYVHNIIKTSPKFFLFDSRVVLKMLSGDYLERSIMFASYARAAGLPTRLVGGLVYRNGYFYFHAWPEVWLGKWVPLDPSLAQFPADATHIPLKEGTLEDIVSIIDDLKKIEIEVMEAL